MSNVDYLRGRTWRGRGGWSLRWELRRWLRCGLARVPGAVGSWMRVHLHGFKHVGIDVAIMEDAWIDFASEVSLGNHVSMNRGVLINAQGGVTVGDWTMIGPGVTIYTQNHALDCGTTPRVLCSDSVAPVSIGRNCWIASNAVVLAGVSIGDGSAVAAGAVVTTNVPPRTLVAGVPARVIRAIRASSSDWE